MQGRLQCVDRTLVGKPAQTLRRYRAHAGVLVLERRQQRIDGRRPDRGKAFKHLESSFCRTRRSQALSSGESLS